MRSYLPDIRIHHRFRTVVHWSISFPGSVDDPRHLLPGEAAPLHGAGVEALHERSRFGFLHGDAKDPLLQPAPGVDDRIHGEPLAHLDEEGISVRRVTEPAFGVEC